MCIVFSTQELSQIKEVAIYNIGEFGYHGPLYVRLLAMTGNMLGPSPMHIKYVYWTMRRPDSLCRNLANADQYHAIHNAIHDVITN